MTMKRLAVVAAAVWLGTASADKDNNYYPAGYKNPNADRKMYWSDAANVLDDLSKFSKLYVSYHNCAYVSEHDARVTRTTCLVYSVLVVCSSFFFLSYFNRWSPYGQDGQENPCGLQEGGDDGVWYMGYTDCFRANAAYSLYGVLKGEEDAGCARSTFINSFFTVDGVEEFTQAAVAAGVSFTSSGADGEVYPSGVTSDCVINDQDSSSYGLACSGTSFAMKSFKGEYCDDERQTSSVSDALRTFNKELSNVVCTPIYTHGSSSSSSSSSNGLTVLQYSRACNVLEFPQSCPDPHGALRTYASAMARSHIKSSRPAVELLKNILSWVLLILGIFLLLGAASLYLARKNRRQKKKQLNGNKKETSGEKSTRGGFFGWRRSRSTASAGAATAEKTATDNGNESTATSGTRAFAFWKRGRFFGRQR
jgi:hypothetical protein